ncbi:Glycerol kinase [Parvularcula bermudensis HTCC2503]|uniref:glycerol kinase n=1 Tax=Parvularcula bermudensis (strain ATCC BAA-594 / HTCC2503 / KCTC 12087) TaxID=314260 RepID=E0TDW2_PARBH|nr:glycerol kinase GlpK [Parvularcula bermudensis]ADM10411.1 Glycerol kinase [Parvularcula bermudensis HTCC2503]
MAEDYILAFDQGTTSARAIEFDRWGAPGMVAQYDLPQHYPDDGWVEHDPADIWRLTVKAGQDIIAARGRPAAIGITNQRETVILWDRTTGEPLHRAIVWQDRRTAATTADLRRDGAEAMVTSKTGLLLDPYFSATKIAWILDHIPGARDKAAAGQVLAGTVDSFLIWHLTGGTAHVTDATNAARTLLFDVDRQTWDEELCALFRVPMACLPNVQDCAACFGTTAAGIFGDPILIGGVAGDQHAAMVGQAAFAVGEVKSTYGTGCFALINTGTRRQESSHRLLSTIAYRLDGQPTYALEGSIFVAGAAIQWLRDNLHFFEDAKETARLAAASTEEGRVVFVPAFTGLGAPYWDPHARGAIFGLTRDTQPADITRAALEAVAFQTADLLRAMRADAGDITRIKVDGGMVANDWLCQRLADILDLEIDRPIVTETTAQGAAVLAGLTVGWYSSLDEAADARRTEAVFGPKMRAEDRTAASARWQDAVSRVLSGPR